MNYFLNEYDALTGYRSDGRFEIGNNIVENAIDRIATARIDDCMSNNEEIATSLATVSALLANKPRNPIVRTAPKWDRNACW